MKSQTSTSTKSATSTVSILRRTLPGRCLNSSHCRLMVVTMLMAGFPLVMGCLPAAVEAPESFTHWNSKDGSFAVDYPEGWTANGSGSRASGMAWAKFNSGSYSVEIEANFGDSIKAEGAMGAGGDLGLGLLAGEEGVPEFMTPVGAIQASWKSSYEEKYKDYVEEPGEEFKTKLGPTVMNKFSAKSGFKTIKGIRSTTLSNDRSVSFIAICPEKQWDIFGPIYEEMLRGMKLGFEEL